MSRERLRSNLSPDPLVVRLLSQNGALEEEKIARHMPGNTLHQDDIRFTTEDESDIAVAVVLNYLKYDTLISARDGYVWNWHNEPIVRRPFAKGYDRVHTHITDSGDKRVRLAPPILDWWLAKTYDELRDMELPQKEFLVSAIASTKVKISGHKVRNAFIEGIEASIPEVHVFGHGRAVELADKWDGLAPFRYSITVENTSKPHYWTEKITDCFLAYTVPIYFGATNIGAYFPAGSYIWLPLDDVAAAEQQLREILSSDNWEERLPAIKKARELVLDRYSLYGQLTRRVREERESILGAPRVTKRVHGRRTRPGGWIRGLGLSGNLIARLERRKQRLARQTANSSLAG